MICRERRRVLQNYLRLSIQALGKDIVSLSPLPYYFTQDMLNTSRVSGNPGGNDNKDSLEFVKSVILFTARRYGLDTPRVAVKFSQLPSPKAGHVFSRNGTWYVEINEEYRNNKVSLAAIAIHELAHVMLDLRGVNISPTIANEELTDAVSVLAGFGEIMQRASSQKYINPWILLLGGIHETTIKIGYLNKEEMAYLVHLQSLIHKQSPIRRLSPVSIENNFSIQCYACGSQLKAAPTPGHFNVGCKHCGMRQRVTFGTQVCSNQNWQKIRNKILQPVFIFADSLRGFDLNSISHKRIIAVSEIFGVILANWFLVAIVVFFAWRVSTSSTTTSRPTPPRGSTYEMTDRDIWKLPSKPAPFPKNSSKPYEKTRKAYARPLTAPDGQPWPTSASYLPGDKQHETNGLSTVTVDNSQNDSDVLVKLFAIDAIKPLALRTFFIPKHETFTLNKVSTGNYDIRYRDLDSGHLSRSETFKLQETRKDNGTQFSKITMTLYKVKNGNMQTYELAEEEF